MSSAKNYEFNKKLLRADSEVNLIFRVLLRDIVFDVRIKKANRREKRNVKVLMFFTSRVAYKRGRPGN